MRKLLIFLLLASGGINSHALVINEIMSNPTGDDSGREWVEVYNNSNDTLDLSSLTISIKGGGAVVVTPVSGGTTISPNGYAIIGSTVTGATKFLQDYPSYNGQLFKSAISLVNTGVTSISIKLNGATADTLASYTSAKEGSTLSLISGSFVTSNPTPGAENQATASQDSSSSLSNGTTTETQATVAQMSPPSADIVLYMPTEKTIVAGAETIFSTFGLTRNGNPISNLTYTWAFGDGGQGVGSTTQYRYVYPGRYIIQVEGTNGYVLGTGRMYVRVVSPDLTITKTGNGKYGAYIDITNPNTYDLDISQWRLSINGSLYTFPKNTLIARGETTHVSGVALGFASTTIASSTMVKILFPNQEEVTRYHEEIDEGNNHQIVPSLQTQEVNSIVSKPTPNYLKTNSTIPSKHVPQAIKQSTTTQSTTLQKQTINSKDTRIVTLFKSIFKK